MKTGSKFRFALLTLTTLFASAPVFADSRLNFTDLEWKCTSVDQRVRVSVFARAKDFIMTQSRYRLGRRVAVIETQIEEESHGFWIEGILSSVAKRGEIVVGGNREMRYRMEIGDDGYVEVGGEMFYKAKLAVEEKQDGKWQPLGRTDDEDDSNPVSTDALCIVQEF